MVTTKPREHRVELLKALEFSLRMHDGPSYAAACCGQELYTEILTPDYINRRLAELRKRLPKCAKDGDGEQPEATPLI